MPRSAIGMSDHDGDYVFDIEAYLISAYPNMTKPVRRAVCSKVRTELNDEAVEEMVDEIISSYSLELQQWRLIEDD